MVLASKASFAGCVRPNRRGPAFCGWAWITGGGAEATFISNVEVRDQYADPRIYPAA